MNQKILNTTLEGFVEADDKAIYIGKPLTGDIFNSWYLKFWVKGKVTKVAITSNN